MTKPIKSDFFGLFAGIRGSVETYFRASRATGRTASLIAALEPDDRVVCASAKEANHLKNTAMRMGKDINVIVVNASRPADLIQHSTSQGRTVFDHGWIENFYLARIYDANAWIADAETRMSGFGESHRETHRAALEARKWE